QTLLLGDDEVGRFSVPIGPVDLQVTVRFTAPEAPEAVGRWQFENGVLSLEFSGWGSPVGGSLTKPQRIGDFLGEVIGFNLAHQRLGSLNYATFQFYRGGKYE